LGNSIGFHETQTLRETKTENGHTQITDYTLGHDEITQRVHGNKADGNAIDQTHVFGHDGHGSVRVLYDLAEAIANGAQVLTFSAYGQMLAVHAVTGGAVATQSSSLTSLGYSGEHFDAQAAQQYLRARFYNPATGTFNRLDPFSGNMHDPQSLHKYLYVHGDPVQGVDPSGEMTLLGIVKVGAIIGGLAGFGHGAISGAKHGVGHALFQGAVEGLLGAIIGAGAGLVIGTGGIGLAHLARALGVFLPPKTAIYGLATLAGLAGVHHGAVEIRDADNPYDRFAGMFTLLLSMFGTAAGGYATYRSAPRTWIPWGTRTQFRGTTHYEALETVENQALNLSRIASRQSTAELDLGPGIYTTSSEASAAHFAALHGTQGRGGGPSILVVRMTNFRWWWLRARHGAVEEVPISDMPGHTQNFVPEGPGAQAFNQYAVFFLRAMTLNPDGTYTLH
jgi:RHS repeat-associated protein